MVLVWKLIGFYLSQICLLVDGPFVAEPLTPCQNHSAPFTLRHPLSPALDKPSLATHSSREQSQTSW